MSAGPEESNALVQVKLGGAWEPMARATDVELFDGLEAEGLAGRGRLAGDAGGMRHDKRYAHCDVLVIGGGPAGLAAADAAAASGARVVLLEAQRELGGSLLAAAQEQVDGGPALEWAVRAGRRLAAAEEARVLVRTTAVGVYDAGYVVAVQRRTDHLGAAAAPGDVRERLWHIRAKRVVVATGALERPIAFPGNDLPGVMLAGAAAAYVTRWAVAPGSRAVVFTACDSGHDAARVLAGAGIEVAAVADARDGVLVTRALGTDRLESVELGGEGIACDLLAVCGGWNPTTQLLAQGTLRWDAAIAAYRPDAVGDRQVVAGAANGTFDLAGCLAEGAAAGRDAATDAGFPPLNGTLPPRAAARDVRPPLALWAAGQSTPSSLSYVDLQRDATVADVERAVAAGLRSPEHVKRFTTVGTANDQGRTSGVLTLGLLAELTGVALDAVAPTSARPPFVPVAFSTLAGRDRGELSDPVRRTPMHAWHARNGAVFEDVGQWKRPWYYPRAGESMDDAVLRECAAAREGVAVMDASTLGKIDVQGPDAVTLLNRLYTGDFSKMKPGRCKYGVLCTVDGMVFDDGVHMRLAEDRFLVTTTTGNAAAVLDWFEEWLQTEWPELRVHCTSVTEQWATVAVVGPRSRDVIGALAPDLDVSKEAFRFMDIRETEVAGIPARVCRISFSGELAYEINVDGRRGLEVWEAVMAAGEPHGITPYGTETMHVLRAEKGYVIVGQDTDGTVTPQDVGLEWMIAADKGDFVGKRSHARPDTVRPDRKQLVGLLPDDPQERLPEGAQLVDDPGAPVPVPMSGHVTSSYNSAALGRTFALGLLRGGRERHGETVHIPLIDRTVTATVVDPVLLDPEGARRDG
jgi:sarcosine oxidase subunit alpha